MKRRTALALGLGMALGAPGAAAGGFSVLTVRVPNERDNKGTVKVDLHLPHGF